MPRVIRVRKARKDQGSCGKCHKPLSAGGPYIHWSFRYGGKRKRCADAACSPRPSDLTNSDKLSRLYAAQETAGDSLGDWDREDIEAAREILTTAAGEVREVGEEYARGRGPRWRGRGVPGEGGPVRILGRRTGERVRGDRGARAGL